MYFPQTRAESAHMLSNAVHRLNPVHPQLPPWSGYSGLLPLMSFLSPSGLHSLSASCRCNAAACGVNCVWALCATPKDFCVLADNSVIRQMIQPIIICVLSNSVSNLIGAADISFGVFLLNQAFSHFMFVFDISRARL